MTNLVAEVRDDLNKLIDAMKPGGDRAAVARAVEKLDAIISAQVEPPAPLSLVPDDPAAKALAELVRLKDIKEAWEAIPIGQRLTAEQFSLERAYFEDYKINRDNAWVAARAALNRGAEPT